MFCSKIGGECPHPVAIDNSYVFTLMPFEGFTSVYDVIKQAVEGVQDKNFKCDRADKKYTHLSIWCDRICKNIKKAKYLIVDTTGRNPNVFYELGFSHALKNTKAIIISQKIEDAPFDIADVNHIVYSEKDLPELRNQLKNAIITLEKEDVEESYANKSPEEIIKDLKHQLREEEDRSAKFKKEMLELEKRETKLKGHIKELESIQNNPVEEAKNKIAELQGTIAELKSKLKLTEEDKKDTIKDLTEKLKKKEEKLRVLEEEFNNYIGSEDIKALSESLLDDAKRLSEAEKWFNKAYHEQERGNIDTAIEYYTRALELNPEYADAYTNRGVAHFDLKEYEKSIKDHTKAIELNPNDALAYTNRGGAHINLKEYEKAIKDCNKAIELDPNYALAYTNRGGAYDGLKEYEKAIKDLTKAIELNPKEALTYSNRGDVYYNLKEHEKAIKDYTKSIKLDPEDVYAYENLSELEIITGNYKRALKNISKAFSLYHETKDGALLFYLECISKKMLNKNVSNSEEEFSKILKKDFVLDWEFDDIESWIESVDISPDKKAFIIEKTEMIKKKSKLNTAI